MPAMLFVALPDGLLVASREGEGWRAARRLEGHQTTCLAADPGRPERLYCGTAEAGLWRSEDGGATWRPVGAGIASAQVTAVAVSPNERAGGLGVVYAGTEPSALYRSEDGGETWDDLAALRALPSAPTWSFPPRPYTSHVRAIACDPHEPGRVYVAIEAGALVRSTDGGRTWIDRVPSGPWDSHTLATHRLAPGRVYSAAGDGFGRPGSGYCESRDGGETWRRPGEGLRHHYLWGLAVDPANPEAVAISAAPGPYQAHNPASAASAIYRRVGDGEWERATAGLPPEEGTLASSLAAHAAEPGVFYAANNRGVFRSADAGDTWEALPIPWPDATHTRHVAALLAVAP